MKRFDFLIVGQGLAGTVLTYLISQTNRTFLVISDNEISSSKVAAGMFNPVGGKKILKTWLADDLLSSSKIFYKDFERFLNTNFYHCQNIIQIFQDNQEKEQIEKRLEDINYLKYLENNSNVYNFLGNPLGQVNIKDGGWLNLKKMIDKFTDFLQEKSKLLTETFSYDQIIFKDNQYYYQDMIFNQIVFCEGYKSTVNPYFNYLPFQLSKGEVLIIETQTKLPDSILKKGIYLVNLKNHLYKVGATTEWKNLNNNPTENGLEYLKTKLNNLIDVKYEIISHQAGIRPTVSDKKPLLGEHPEYKNMYIFNGLGTKGVMLSPYFAEKLLNLIIYNVDLPIEVDIKRFLKYYKPSFNF